MYSRTYTEVYIYVIIIHVCDMVNQDDVPRLREQMLEELKSGELNL